MRLGAHGIEMQAPLSQSGMWVLHVVLGLLLMEWGSRILDWVSENGLFKAGVGSRTTCPPEPHRRHSGFGASATWRRRMVELTGIGR